MKIDDRKSIRIGDPSASARSMAECEVIVMGKKHISAQPASHLGKGGTMKQSDMPLAPQNVSLMGGWPMYDHVFSADIRTLVPNFYSIL